jgi:hypothetical protein
MICERTANLRSGRRSTRRALDNAPERELAVCDLLTKPAPKLTKAQVIAVKAVAKGLLKKLQDEQLLSPRWALNPVTRACRVFQDPSEAQRAA